LCAKAERLRVILMGIDLPDTSGAEVMKILRVDLKQDPSGD